MIEQLRAQLEAAKAPKPSKGLERKMASLKREVREEWNTQVLEAIGGPCHSPGRTFCSRATRGGRPGTSGQPIISRDGYGFTR